MAATSSNGGGASPAAAGAWSPVEETVPSTSFQTCEPSKPPATTSGPQSADPAVSSRVDDVDVDAALRRSERDRFHRTWSDFRRALHSPAPFDSFSWVVVLFRSAVRYGYHATHLAAIDRRYRIRHSWRPVVPFVAVLLIVLVVASYFGTIRDDVVVKRWCDAGESSCASSRFHTSVVVYLATMILFHYLRCTFQSPGVALPPDRGVEADAVGAGSESVTSPGSSSSPLSPPTVEWKCVDARGGCCFLDPVLDPCAERRLTSLYNAASDDDMGRGCGGGNHGDGARRLPVPLEDNDGGRGDGGAADAVGGGSGGGGRQGEGQGECERVWYHPSPYPSHCDRCQMLRPPRCHHCGTCNRCVLQLDHHCPWVNNCIGLGNYRSFALAVAYLTVGCIYGASMLAAPFYETMARQVRERGFRFLYENRSGFLDLPSPWIMLDQMKKNGRLETKVVVRMVFPLLFAVGIILAWFSLSHIRYIVAGRTTLEHSVLLSIRNGEELRRLREGRGRGSFGRRDLSSGETVSRASTPINPFDEGWRANICRVFGRSVLCAFLPIPIHQPDPFVPNLTKKAV